MIQTHRVKVFTGCLLLLAVCLLAYATLIPWLGFYADDAIIAWVLRAQGRAGVVAYWSIDRPLVGWMEAVTTLIGERPLPWHIFAVLTRWASALAVWWALKPVWPDRNREILMAALLFAVYPGFTALPIAVTISEKVVSLTFLVISIGATLRAARRTRFSFGLMALAIVAQVLSLPYLDYYACTELLRPVMLFALFLQAGMSVRERMRRTALLWLPHLVLILAAVYWRGFVFQNHRLEADPGMVMSEFARTPWRATGLRIYYAFKDLLQSTVMAWARTLQSELFTFDRFYWVISAIVIAAVGGLLTYYLVKRTEPQSGDNGSTQRMASRKWGLQIAIIGLLGVLLGGLPVWFSGRYITLESADDRFTLPMLLGSCLLTLGLIQLFVKGKRRQLLAVSVLVGLSVGFHFRSTDRYRQYWAEQESLLWQLTWRAPGLKPGTSVLIDRVPVKSYTMAPHLNLIYAPDVPGPEAKYWLFNIVRDIGYEVPSLSKDVKVSDTARVFRFEGSTSRSVGVWLPETGCLKVLDPTRDELPQLSAMGRAIRGLSNIDQIVPDTSSPVVPPAEIFGAEPKPCWCYYFQKADLARQRGDWEEAMRLGDEARALGLSPDDRTEWLLFVEAYFERSRYEDARELAGLVAGDSWFAEAAVRNLLDKLERTTATDVGRLECLAALRAQLSGSSL
ncbi:MAG TPA: hypothetical protein VKM94_22165 [Blastocatellia bacterium]|nr:hypothetical protein [Blastocatellia bacterium]